LMYYQAVIPKYLLRDFGSGDLSKQAVINANQSSAFMVRSYNLVPNSAAAFVLAELFRFVRFYVTSIYWFEQASKVATDFEDSKTAIEAKAQKLSLQADNTISDPKIAWNTIFPTEKTPGLITSSQPNSQTATTPFILPPASGLSVPQSGKQSSIKWIKVGVAIMGLGLVMGLMTNHLINLITIAGVIVVIIGFVKARAA
jgi:hypothetical protein